ncbi:MAG: UDP-N-acetylmuramoyl-tripeptide--D-alanyl-D-alanine ligase [Parcubacteria group bacterium Gr01-1014_44]|nr:MAG: UDP-N-acetylmuramoyl-tripeptide--D-alanyl-D-alanine ligase [Parcubacteria group bacterium Gr01-1014_44]
MKKFLQFCLTILAKLYLAKYKPKIVAVTGNTGKTTTKEAIAAVLKSEKKIRMSGGNLNNELGVPLAILGDYTEEYYEKGGTLGFWLKVLFKAKIGLLFGRNYPEILVLEYGADRPGDIAKLAKNFKPDVAVVTAIGEIPVHVEYFSGPKELADEKSKLVEVLEPADFAVLNQDDLAVFEMKDKTKAKIKTFGFMEGAEVKVSDFDFKIGPSGEPEGVVFKIHHGEGFTPFKITGSLGKSQAWAAAAATAVGLIFGLNLVKISDALSAYQGPAGRLKVLKGIKNSWLIDDTYNSSPTSTHLALETLKSFSSYLAVSPLSRRKLAVLGDMLELGQYSIQAHQEAGNLAGTFVDLLITIGSRAKFIADAAGNQMPKENILSFETSVEAAPKVRELIKEGDLVLIKGSQGMRMEKIVEEIMAEPEKKKELLVRQSQKWLEK